MMVLYCGSTAAQQVGAVATEQSEPYPITIKAIQPLPTAGSVNDPLVTTTGSPVELTGKTVGLLQNTVTLDIKAPKASPPQSAHLTVGAGLDGIFKTTYVPKVAGRYEVAATAPDDRGHTSTVFYAENPVALSPAMGTAIDDVGRDILSLPPIIRQKIEDLPPSPAKDDFIRQWTSIESKTREWAPKVKPVNDDIPPMLRGPCCDNDRRLVIPEYARAQRLHQRAQEEIDQLKLAQLTCDNLEQVEDGLKLFSALLDFVSGRFLGVVKNFAQDYAAAQLSNAAKAVTGSGDAGFVAGEAVKLYQPKSFKSAKDLTTLQIGGSNIVAMVNDITSKALEKVMGHFCEMFSGTLKAHMHAEFYQGNFKYWQYDYDVDGLISLHYPKDAHGDSVPLKGRVEGFALNFKLWENALSVLYPGLMTSTVKRAFYIMPDVWSSPAAPVLKELYNVEGSAASNAVVPNSFFIPIHGTATKDELDIQVDAANVDMDAKTTVITLYMPVLSLSPGVMAFALPYKPVHFVFERAGSSYKVPLHTSGEKIVGTQHFENKKGNEEAKGEYSVDLQLCNPDCDTSIWDSK